MSADTEDKVRDVVIWYHENYKRIPRENLVKRLDFQEKCISCLLEIVAMQAKDLQVAEKRNGRTKLWLPATVKLDNEQTIQLRD